jgi:hypothetical protein
MKTIFFLSFLLVSCGDLKYDQATASPTPSPSPAADKEVTVETNKHLSAKATASASCSTEADKYSAQTFKFVNSIKTYREAKRDVPEGYRLATRSELLTALDDGALGEFGDEIVWTDNEIGEDNAWTFRLRDGYLSPYDKLSLFRTIYVKDIE